MRTTHHVESVAGIHPGSMLILRVMNTTRHGRIGIRQETITIRHQHATITHGTTEPIQHIPHGDTHRTVAPTDHPHVVVDIQMRLARPALTAITPTLTKEAQGDLETAAS
jgi:hypothetical protein